MEFIGFTSISEIPGNLMWLFTSLRNNLDRRWGCLASGWIRRAALCAEEKSHSPFEWRTTGKEKEKDKRGWKQTTIVGNIPWCPGKIETWGPEKRETVGQSQEGGLCSALWHTKRRTATEAGITLTYFHIQAQSFLIHSWPLSHKVN